MSAEKTNTVSLTEKQEMRTESCTPEGGNFLYLEFTI